MASKLSSMEDLGESWVELGNRSVTPLAFAGEECLRLLKEAQRDGFSVSSRHTSGRTSPKSPPNSPNTEPSTEDELRGMDYNYCASREGELSSAEWVWQWSSRPDQMPPKDWRFRHPLGPRAPLSLRKTKIGGRALFSTDLLASLLLSNLLSLLLGVGFGVWLSRRSPSIPRIALR